MNLLSFSEPFLQVTYSEFDRDIQITGPTIVFNASHNPLVTGPENIAPRTSALLQNVTIGETQSSIHITSEDGFSAVKLYPSRDELMRKWTHVHDIFHLAHLEHTTLWKSPTEQIGNKRVNLWFAAEGTDCGLHNEHHFLEVHTQIWGTGHMQKFHERDEKTLYRDIFMTPGFTHEPFCGDDHKYPWHRYYAETDCLWLAVEYDNN